MHVKNEFATKYSKLLIPPVFLIIFILIFFPSVIFPAEKNYSVDEIKPRLKIHNGPIINNSDTLYAGDKLLIRDQDYSIDYISGTIVLTNRDSINFPLMVIYTPLPSWLGRSFGNVPPTRVSGNSRETSSVTVPMTLYARPTDEQGISINGAKKFSVLTSTGGSSQFSQTLDLSISGELTPGIELSGSISDRGYDPTYGSLNSRISELDKLLLQVKSRTFFSQVGNLTLDRKSGFGGSSNKQVSGLLARYEDSRFHGSFLLARPRGEFNSVQLYGQDQIQGPYQIIVSGNLEAIVPGSEQVWVDGRLLERGADKDYTVDYPTASITFAQGIMIDSRSRIEVDYELLNDNYQKELVSVGTGARFNDSTFYYSVSAYMEGDDKENLKTGELTTADRAILSTIGDSTNLNYRDGAVPDEYGDYVLVDEDTVSYYEYVGDSLGDYRVGFSFVGTGNGDYRYDGDNVYSYVGNSNGDYLPLSRIPVPSNEQHYEAIVGGKLPGNIKSRLLYQLSQYDRNLYSNKDDYNNHGDRYLFDLTYGGEPAVFAKKSGVLLNAEIVGKNFKSLQRRRHPDLNRIFYIPDNLIDNKDEYYLTGKSAVILPGYYNIFVNGGYLEYSEKYKAIRGEATAYPDDGHLYFPVITAGRLNSTLDTSNVSSDGNYEILAIEETARINDDLTIFGEASYDRRWNNYKGETRGTTEKLFSIGSSFKKITISAERKYEDTLLTDWENIQRRDRANIIFSDNTGNFRLDARLIGQRLKRGSSIENQLLARSAISYSIPERNLSINAAYTLSRENRYERGIRYVEVDPGQGQYILEDGQYIPDANGNYIQVEEILSNQAQVDKGEKSLAVVYSPDNYYIRVSSNQTDELFADENRTIAWLVPFYTNSDRQYFNRKNNYSGEIRMIRGIGFYYFNLSGSRNYESRSVNLIDREKYESNLMAEFNQPYGGWRFKQVGELFQSSRDSYYYSAGKIDGYKASFDFIRKISIGQITMSSGYRYASDDNDNFSRQLLVGVVSRLRLFPGGETSLNLDLYLQKLESDNAVSYRLTDNLYGKRGAVWTIRSNYSVSRDIKLSLYLNGRHSDNRTARITGKGEVIALF